MITIPQEEYSREYYLSQHDSCHGGSVTYDRFRRGGKPAAIFLQAVKYIQKYKRGPFLDIGCGRGELTIYLARGGKKAYGIDYSRAAIKICGEALKREKKSVRDNTHFQIGDSTKLKFRNNFFNGVFLLDVVEHLTPMQVIATLKEVHRVLRHGGILIIHTNNRYFERFSKLAVAFIYHGWKIFLRPNKTLQEASQNKYEYMHINYVSGGEMKKYLKQAGFESIVYYVKPKKKKDLQKFTGYNGWKKYIYHNIAWAIFNSPFIRFFSPTLWVVSFFSRRNPKTVSKSRQR